MTMPNSATSTHLITFRGQNVNHADLVNKSKIRQSPIHQ